ncbi:hypothetical protein [Methyloceanibacter sp.]|uniref:hypothetical protein n=1 Tax=Methyloceanibacter sp. TaxID=1965321 RepID=UPI002CE64750|nr:hypothetical protein [Methyloceanibacter sp.]HML92382.1 hypothetical protein [Methyloceanibacter sp.]
MLRFLLFVGLLVTAAYIWTAPPRHEVALGAGEAPALKSKPLLTSWGPTLGSLRTGSDVPATPDAASARGTQTAANAQFHQYGPKTELWVLGQSNGFKDPANAAAEDRGWVSDGYVEGTVIAAATRSAAEIERANAEAAKPATTVAAVATPDTAARAKPSEPVIDRIAAARPPQRRGLFARIADAEPRAPAAETRRGTRNRGFFARLMGRGKPAQPAFALGPAR